LQGTINRTTEIKTEIDVIRFCKKENKEIAKTLLTPFLPRLLFMKKWFAINLDDRTLTIPSLNKIKSKYPSKVYIGGLAHEHAHAIYTPINPKADIIFITGHAYENTEIPIKPELGKTAINIVSDIVNELILYTNKKYTEGIIHLNRECLEGISQDKIDKRLKNPVSSLLTIHTLLLSGKIKSVEELTGKAPKNMLSLYLGLYRNIVQRGTRDIRKAKEEGTLHYVISRSRQYEELLLHILGGFSSMSEISPEQIEKADTALLYLALSEALYMIMNKRGAPRRLVKADMEYKTPSEEEVRTIYESASEENGAVIMSGKMLELLADRFALPEIMLAGEKYVEKKYSRKETYQWLQAPFTPPTPESVIRSEALGLGVLGWEASDEEEYSTGEHVSVSNTAPPKRVSLVIDESMSTASLLGTVFPDIGMPVSILALEKAVLMGILKPLLKYRKTRVSLIRFSTTVLKQSGTPEEIYKTLRDTPPLLEYTNIVDAINMLSKTHKDSEKNLIAITTDAFIEESEAKIIADTLSRFRKSPILFIVFSQEELPSLRIIRDKLRGRNKYVVRVARKKDVEELRSIVKRISYYMLHR